MFPVVMCSVVRAEYIPHGGRQRHSALGEVSTVMRFMRFMRFMQSFRRSSLPPGLLLSHLIST